jgi:hypothetical protein
VEDKTLKMALGAFDDMRDIQPETWLNAYRYRVSNGVVVLSMSLVKHIPSHVVAGYRTQILYEGQPTTCYSCNEPGHLQTACPQRRRGSGKQPGNHGIMGGSGGEGAHFKHHDNIG